MVLTRISPGSVANKMGVNLGIVVTIALLVVISISFWVVHGEFPTISKFIIFTLFIHTLVFTALPTILKSAGVATPWSTTSWVSSMYFGGVIVFYVLAIRIREEIFGKNHIRAEP